MSNLQIALVVGAIVIALAGAWWLQRRSNPTATAESDRIDTVTGWPAEPTRLLNGPERMAYSILRQALPDYMVFAQVPLSRFLNVRKRNSYSDWLRRVGNQCIDFVVCDADARVIAVIELQAAQSSERARKRMARITRTLKAVGIPLRIWLEDALPPVQSVRETIAVDATTPAQVPRPAQAAQPAPAPQAPAPVEPAAPHANPFDDTQRDSEHDERIELLEPPPTWYDDLDSDTAPLGKK